jgi:endonuclease YncB( thermonuclease family)
MRLVGIDAPPETDCHGRQTRDELNRLVGKTVRVEAESGSPGGDSIAGYLWLDAASGTPVLVNQQLIAGGFAKVRADEQTARFGAWLAESQRKAQTEQTGLWGQCLTTSANPPVATPFAT